MTYNIGVNAAQNLIKTKRGAKSYQNQTGLNKIMQQKNGKK
jgi:hypothetical protein